MIPKRHHRADPTDPEEFQWHSSFVPNDLASGVNNDEWTSMEALYDPARAKAEGWEQDNAWWGIRDSSSLLPSGETATAVSSSTEATAAAVNREMIVPQVGPSFEEAQEEEAREDEAIRPRRRARGAQSKAARNGRGQRRRGQNPAPGFGGINFFSVVCAVTSVPVDDPSNTVTHDLSVWSEARIPDERVKILCDFVGVLTETKVDFIWGDGAQLVTIVGIPAARLHAVRIFRQILRNDQLSSIDPGWNEGRYGPLMCEGQFFALRFGFFGCLPASLSNIAYLNNLLGCFSLNYGNWSCFSLSHGRSVSIFHFFPHADTPRGLEFKAGAVDLPEYLRASLLAGRRELGQPRAIVVGRPPCHSCDRVGELPPQCPFPSWNYRRSQGMQVRHGSDILAPLNHIGTVDPAKLESLGGPITGPHDASQDQDRRPPSAMHEASLSSCLGPYGYFDVSIQGLLVRGRTQIWARRVPFNVHMSEKCMFALEDAQYHWKNSLPCKWVIRP